MKTLPYENHPYRDEEELKKERYKKLYGEFSNGFLFWFALGVVAVITTLIWMIF